MNAVQSESEYVKAQSIEWAEKTRKALRTVHKTGKAPSKWWRDSLESQGLITFGPPREDIRYNCYHVTFSGWNFSMNLERFMELLAR